MSILVTGANGFIGKNLCFNLLENGYNNITEIDIESSDNDLLHGLENADIIFHLAGVNRPDSDSEFEIGNTDFTQTLTKILIDLNKNTPIVFSSSTQAENNSPYGVSKVKAENVIKDYSQQTQAKYYIYRLPSVFGKWCAPNYNSFVATFCHNLARGLAIEIHNPSSKVDLVYIDDVCSSFISMIGNIDKEVKGYRYLQNVYETTVGEVSELLQKFIESRTTLLSENVGVGFERALYATYISYLEPEKFSYTLSSHEDERGIFCEFLKTKSSGQFSFFTVNPGVTRGGHYHHTKSEKFLVVEGKARFIFENIDSKENFELKADSSQLKVIESIPGWAHNIQNIGENKLIVMLWANEVFDRQRPDTISIQI